MPVRLIARVGRCVTDRGGWVKLRGLAWLLPPAAIMPGEGPHQPYSAASVYLREDGRPHVAMQTGVNEGYVLHQYGTTAYGLYGVKRDLSNAPRCSAQLVQRTS